MMIKKFTHSITSLLKSRPDDQQLDADRRKASRVSVRLPVKAFVLDHETGTEQVNNIKPLIASTKELSSIGLSFVLSEVQIAGLDLMKRHGRLRIALELPTGEVEIYGTVASISRLIVGESQEWSVIGVRMTQTSEADRVTLLTYLGNVRNADELLFEDLASIK